MISKTFAVLLLASVFNASGDDCNVIPLSQWAGEGILRQEVLATPISLVVVQHSVTPEGNTAEECEGIVRSIRNYHMKILKFDDIGQSFLICGNGRIYEGAGWFRVGAHTKGLNKKAIGLSFLGDFTSVLPTPEAMKAAQELLCCGVRNGFLTEDFKVKGHRQLSNTKSPGDALQKEIELWPQWTSQ